MNIIHIVGNRPQFIKLGLLHKAIAATGIEQQIIHTGQHSSNEMSGIFFGQLQIPEATHRLTIPEAEQSVFIMNMTKELVPILEGQKNAVVLVYGDTNTTLAGALAAKEARKPLYHFEGGVRTDDFSMPEELNRIQTDQIAQVNYCCTQLNLEQLHQESSGQWANRQAILTGDLMYDAFLHTGMATTSPVSSSNYIACTIHRAQHITDALHLRNIVAALNALHLQQEVIVPLHPHTAKRLAAFEIQPTFTIIPPLGYLEMKRFLTDAAYVITDSGGAAREAYFARKFSLVIMRRPFWPEIVSAGAALNCMPEEQAILQAFEQLPRLTGSFNDPIFGKGDAAQKICDHLVSVKNSLS